MGACDPIKTKISLNPPNIKKNILKVTHSLCH